MNGIGGFTALIKAVKITKERAFFKILLIGVEISNEEEG